MLRKLFIIIAMMVVGLSWLASPTLAQTDAQWVDGNQTVPKVVFRLDDVQDWYQAPSQIAVMEAFANYSVEGKNSPQSLSIGVIGCSFGDDELHVKKIEEIMTNLGERGEVVSHSMTHEDFSAKTLEKQIREFKDFKTVADIYFPGKTVRTFIAPYNEYDECTTVKAMKLTGYDILSAQCTPDFCYNAGDPSSTPAYLPAGASTGGWTAPYKIQTANKIFAEIQAQIKSNDNQNWSVVMMHPFEFTKGEDTEEVNPCAIETLKKVIEMCLDNGYELVTYTQLVDSVR
ncbi:MAG: hypothetical protein F6K48_01140 [Okeania sp. SIO3H1]|uniref:hypothetical protein n=1 Tax=Okeania sp. SIO1I7 TaxID=2607772 RepID=UPI0013C978A8|nr:hypothetical protein [Okeania sp. SIO1I7]NEN87602.1 hypothetical protein [Okeania sp. SIO3H1]NET24007.1 hypothetical protein [Okeania sp. SIO1I7]